MELEQQQQIGAMWGLGDYTQIAERLSPAAAAVVTTVSKRAGVGARPSRVSTSDRTKPPLTLPFDDSSADLVGSSFGLIFAQDPDQALGEMSRVLRPGEP